MQNSKTLEYYQSYFKDDSYLLSPETFIIALQAFKSALQKKGKQFNAVFLEVSENIDDDTFTNFFTHLKNNRSKKTQRFQVIYYYDGHYSILDIEVNMSFINVYCLDAADISQAIPPLFILNKIFPNANIYYTGGFIQTDIESCAYFALYLAHHLSKIPKLHSDIKNLGFSLTLKNFEKMKNELEDFEIMTSFSREEVDKILRNLKKVAYKDLPQAYGFLFKYMQNVSFFDKNLNSFKTFSLKKNLTLHDFIHGHSEKINIRVYQKNSNSLSSFAIKEVPFNNAIELKRQKIHREAHAYIKAIGKNTLFSAVTNNNRLLMEDKKARTFITDFLKWMYSFCGFEVCTFLLIIMFVCAQMHLKEEKGFNLSPR